MTETDDVRDGDRPDAWRAIERRGAGPFTTWVTYRRPDGFVVRWESRAHRKHHNRLDRGHGTTWWAPGAVAWWIGILFMLGSFFFALGSVPGYVDEVGTVTDNMTFFVGSIFFTSAAALGNLGTFVGALGFFVGAFLLLPERTDRVDPDPVRLIPST